MREIDPVADSIAARKKAVAADTDGLERQLADGARQVTPTIVEQFAKPIAGKLRDTSGGNLRRAHTRHLADRV